MKSIVLASSSVYRQGLLKRMGLAFVSAAPGIAENELSARMLNEGKTPQQVAEQLASEKARVVAAKFPDSLIIAGDQLVSHRGQVLGKPGTAQAAVQQLQNLRGETHELVTALVLLSAERFESHVDITRLKMKNLSDRELEAYVALDQPLDCAGSYKIEKSGIVLFESVESADFSAIQGIQLIWLSNRLKEYGYEFFTNTAY